MTACRVSEVDYLSASVHDMTNSPLADGQTEWVSPGVAAAVLGVSTRTVSRLADRGEVRALRVPGGHRRYDIDSLEALLARAADWSRQ